MQFRGAVLQGSHPSLVELDMHIRQLRTRHFRRFHDLTLDLPTEPRLVVMCGPNGMGKSSLIDAVSLWHRANSGGGWGGDASYFGKAGEEFDWSTSVEVTFAEPLPNQAADRRRLVYARSSYRHEPDFSSSNLTQVGDIFTASRTERMIDAEVKVADNYRRIASQAMDDLFGGKNDELNVGVLRDIHIGKARAAMLKMFPDLELQGPGNPVAGGTFYFSKAGTEKFHYKNLSGGEKAAFDLVLDLVVKSAGYDDAVYFIDEPEVHLNPRLQSELLDTLLSLLPAGAQLWIATHSIGMMRKAQLLYRADPPSVAFFDFEGHNFDLPISLKPVVPTRKFWSQQLSVALGDMADLIAPDCVVLCEGKPVDGSSSRAEFDARCYRLIFEEGRPMTDFVSVGNAFEVMKDRVELGRTIQALVTGTKVIRLIDRDDRSVQEVADIKAGGTRVLRRRHIESYLLDDEVLNALAQSLGRTEDLDDVRAAREAAVANSVARGNDEDDLKSASGEFHIACKRILGLKATGTTAEAFLLGTLAPLVRVGMRVYAELVEDIFGEQRVN